MHVLGEHIVRVRRPTLFRINDLPDQPRICMESNDILASSVVAALLLSAGLIFVILVDYADVHQLSSCDGPVN